MPSVRKWIRRASQGLSFSDGKRDPLFSRKVYWLLNERRERKPRPKVRFDFVCGASELDGSHYDAALHSPLEWLLAQTRESRGGYGTQLFRVQLHQNSSYTSRVASYGRWRHGSAWSVEDLKPTTSGGRKERRK